jgi:hypothetical protein
MYQLSHMLTDQKSIMNAMIEMSITGQNGQFASILLCTKSSHEVVKGIPE